MPREQFTVDGVCPTVTLPVPAGTASTTQVYDVYVSNVGSGAMTFAFNYADGDDGFSGAHRIVENHTNLSGIVDVESGEVFKLDREECLHIVITKNNSGTPAAADITVTNGLKTHITAATTNNDYITLVGDPR